MNIKEIFEKAGGAIDYEQFKTLAETDGAKFADLSEGKYVSKSKYDSDLKAKDTQIANYDEQITALNETITTRDADLTSLKTKLEEAGQDATKLADLTNQFTGLQSKYEEDMKASQAMLERQKAEYTATLQKQAYEFAVKDYANTMNFSSGAAKRDFTKSLLEKNLQMEGDKILGRDDFRDAYMAENPDAFVVEDEPVFEPIAEPKSIVPEFVAPTPGPTYSEGDGFDFNFLGVR